MVYIPSHVISVGSDILEKAIDTFGTSAQIDKVIEEMAELTQALLKERQARLTEGHKESIAHVQEEIADVYIMLAQLTEIFCKRFNAIDYEELEDTISYKINRLRVRMLK